MKRNLVLAIIAGIMLGVFSGCTKPPKAERELAEKAFKDASIAKDCDKENYLAAEELLNKARDEVNKKNYAKAKELFAAVKKKSDEMVKYYQSHPDECLPKKKEVKKEKKEDIEEVEDPAKNPDAQFQAVHFEYNEYTIRSEDLPKVELVSRWMGNFSEKVIRVEGHADERGSIDYNMSLGEKRASEVKDKLIQLGIDSKRIKIVSYGEEKPVDQGHNESAWYENRRAEFKKVN